MEEPMGDKLQQGDRFPQFSFNLTDGSVVTIPENAPSRYTVLLFYRGHW